MIRSLICLLIFTVCLSSSVVGQTTTPINALPPKAQTAQDVLRQEINKNLFIDQRAKVAVELAQRLVALEKLENAPDSEPVAKALEYAILAYYCAEDLVSMAAAGKDAIAIFEKTSPKNTWKAWQINADLKVRLHLIRKPKAIREEYLAFRTKELDQIATLIGKDNAKAHERIQYNLERIKAIFADSQIPLEELEIVGHFLRVKSYILAAEGKMQESIQTKQLALAVMNKALGSEYGASQQLLLYELGDRFRTVGEYDKAEIHLRKAAEIAAVVLPLETADRSKALSLLALCLVSRGEKGRASEIATEAASFVLAHHTIPVLQRARVLTTAADVVSQCNSLDQAISWCDAAKAILKSSDLDKTETNCDALQILGNARVVRKEWNAASANFQEIITISKAISSKDRLQGAQFGLALVALESGDLDQADQLCASVSDQLRVEGRERSIYYRNVQYRQVRIDDLRISKAYQDRNFADVRAGLEKKEKRLTDVDGPNNFVVRSCRLEREALDRISALSAKDYAEWLVTYQRFFVKKDASDDDLNAEQIFTAMAETALTFERLLGNDYFQIAFVKASLGRALFNEKQYARAVPVLNEAVAGFDRQWPAPNPHPRVANCLYYLGVIQTRHVVQKTLGIQNLERAASILRSFPDEENTRIDCLKSIADARYWGADLRRAEVTAVEWLDLCMKAQGKDSFGVFEARTMLGDIRLAQGDGKAALEHFSEAKRLSEYLKLGIASRAACLAKLGQATVLNGDPPNGEKLLRDSLALFKTGPARPFTYGRANADLGNLCIKLGKADEGALFLTEAAANYDLFPGIDAVYANGVRFQLASLEVDKANVSENAFDPLSANEHRQAALNYIRKILGADHYVVRLHEGYIESNKKWAALPAAAREKVDGAFKDSQQAVRVLEKGQAQEAFALHVKAGQALEAALGKEDIRCVFVESQRAQNLYQLGRNKESEQAANSAIASFDKLLGANNQYSANLSLLLGNIYRWGGQPGEAVPHYLKAFKISLAVNPQSVELYVALLRLAQCRLALDKPQEALADMSKAVRNLRVFSTTQPGLFTDALASACELSARLGDFDWAEIQAREAAAYVKARKLEGTQSEANAMRAMALLKIETRKFEEGESSARRWIEIVKPQDGEQTTALGALAIILTGKGDRTTGEALARQVIERAERLPGFEMAPAATARIILSGIRFDAGDLQGAEESAKAAAEELEKKATPGHRRTIAAYEQLAQVYQARGKIDAAVKLRGRVLTLAIEALDREAVAATGDQLIELADRARVALYSYLNLPIGQQSTELTYNALLKLKGATLARQRQLRLAAADPTRAALAAEWRRVGAELATEALTPPFKEGLTVWLQSLATRMETFNTLETQLAAAVKPLDSVTIADVRKSLPADTVLVDYLRYPHVKVIPGKPGQEQREYRYVAFVLKRGSDPVRVELPNAKAVAEGVTEWRAAIEEVVRLDVGERFSKGVPKARQILAKVSAAIWDPLRLAVGDATSLYVSPDGPLAAIPFPALPGTGPQSFLIEEMSVMVVPAARMLVDAQPAANIDPTLLVIGQVDYGAATSKLSNSSKSQIGGYTKLSLDHLETGDVNQRFDDAFPKGKRVYLSEQQPTEDAFRRQASQYRWIHVSTHGFFSEDNTGYTYLARASLPGIAEVAVPEVAETNYFMRVLKHPGLQCGIGLTGANVPNKPGEDDGVLTAFEASLLDLSGVDTLVLSACQTALGSTKDGEGVLGLQRAFHQAGVHTVVATLWSVPVIETLSISDQLYGYLWATGAKQANALQASQRNFIREARESVGKKDGRPYQIHPYFWAGYSVSGDGK